MSTNVPPSHIPLWALTVVFHWNEEEVRARGSAQSSHIGAQGKRKKTILILAYQKFDILFMMNFCINVDVKVLEYYLHY